MESMEIRLDQRAKEALARKYGFDVCSIEARVQRTEFGDRILVTGSVLVCLTESHFNSIIQG